VARTTAQNDSINPCDCLNLQRVSWSLVRFHFHTLPIELNSRQNVRQGLERLPSRGQPGPGYLTIHGSCLSSEASGYSTVHSLAGICRLAIAIRIPWPQPPRSSQFGKCTGQGGQGCHAIRFALWAGRPQDCRRDASATAARWPRLPKRLQFPNSYWMVRGSERRASEFQELTSKLAKHSEVQLSGLHCQGCQQIAIYVGDKDAMDALWHS
jgi:hypothetical protein